MQIKKYKRPFYKTETIKTSYLSWVIALCLIIVYRDAFKFWLWSTSETIAALIIGTYLGVLFRFGFCKQLYYIEIREETLALKNGILRNVSKVVSCDVKIECLIAYERTNITHYMKFRRKGQKRWGRYYGIDLVDPKDLKEIISILESKGVTVITKDLRADV